MLRGPRSARVRALIAAVFFASLRVAATQNQATPPPAQNDEQLARRTCAACHGFPTPDILPRSAWRNEFVRMMFIRQKRQPPAGRPDVVYSSIELPPDMERVLPYYMSRAPALLRAP